jgi:hypothetical protein
MTMSHPEHQTSAQKTRRSDDLPKLTSETVRAFVTELHADPQLKAEVIDALDTKGLAAMVAQFFSPSEHQKKLLDGSTKSPEMHEITKAAIRNALTTGGTIEIGHSPSEVERTALGVSAAIAGFHININIDC